MVGIHGSATLQPGGDKREEAVKNDEDESEPQEFQAESVFTH